LNGILEETSGTEVSDALQLEHQFIQLLLGTGEGREALGTIQDAAAHVLREVTQQVLRDLEDPENWPQAMVRGADQPTQTYGFPFVTTLSKKLFSTFRRQWNTNKKVQAGIEPGTELSTDRRIKRRKRKSVQLIKILELYAAKCGLDPDFLLNLLHEQCLSDEVSGPEEGSGETKGEWKVRMAAALGLPLDANSLKTKKFLEVLVPDWRSDFYSSIIHDIEKFRFDRMSDSVKGDLRYDRVPGGRRSDWVPTLAPYNFGISREWLNKHSNDPAYRATLKAAKWDSYPEPEGCGLEGWEPVGESVGEGDD
ncbi:hypothetical protein B0H13DRAFT_1867715, partial [Mycena leptocephala]